MSGACPIDEGCLEWVHEYLLDCVCNLRDEVSLLLGLMSVFSWGVAEVPQIITNFKEKTTEGVSLAFLMTWVVGDVFNLAGCWLEPATLPTQFYMALLYTLTTLVLVGQTVYYDYCHDYFHPQEPLPEDSVEDEPDKSVKLEVEGQSRPRPVKRSGSSSPELSSSVISVPHSRRGSRDLYYTSARSLASSHTPTVGSYLMGSGSRDSGGQNPSILRSPGNHDSGSVISATEESPIEGDSSRSSYSGGGGSTGRTALLAAASFMLVGTVGLSSNFLSGGSSGLTTQAGGRAFLQTGRKLLMLSSGFSKGPKFITQHYLQEVQAEGPWGEIFGWCMAAIYMGGRLPQILLNMKRGTVEGLNPLMFIFALLGNVTYVGSILVRSLQWVQIKPNLPWLVDAGVCVFLDIFILFQFVYYAWRNAESEKDDEEDKKGSYTLVSS